MSTDNIAIQQHGRNALVMDGNDAFTFEVSDSLRAINTYRSKQDSLDWNDNHFNVNGWRILPYGDNNDLPREIQEAVQNNSFAPGMLEKIVMLLWGKGPFVYKERKEGDVVYRDLVDDPALDAWLKSWDYREYLLRCATSYSYVQGSFTKLFRNKAERVPGHQHKIAKLEHVGVECCRLASVYAINSAIATHIVETDFSFNSINSLTDMKVYPIFDIDNPFRYPTTMYYSNMYTFGSKNYTVPKIWGTLGWLRRSTAVPIIFEALSKNSINAKYHIISPQEFWDQAEERLTADCTKRAVTYEAHMLEEYKLKILRGISKVLTSEENVGKFWHTTKSLTLEGNNLLEHGWEIKAIDQNVKDYVTAQIEISKHSIQNLGAGIGLHQANANVSESGKSDSGSEQLYADVNHKNNNNPIPEMIVCKPFNMALEVNFPGKGYKMGFVQVQAQRQQDLSEKDRPKNLN